MFKPVVMIMVLIVTLANFGAVVFADLRAAEVPDGQPSSKEGCSRGAADTSENESLNENKPEVCLPPADRTNGRQSSIVTDATCSGDTCSRIVVGQSESNLDVALGSFDSVTSGSPAIIAANANDTVAVGTEVGRSECAVSNGSADVEAIGQLVTGNVIAVGGNAVTTGGNVTAAGGNATAACNAVGGDAAVIISSSAFSSFINDSSESDFWALLRTLLIQFADDVAAGRTDGNAAAGGQVLCTSPHALAGRGSRVVGGSAVFLADHSGRAVGGSATVLGVVSGRLQVLCHAAGEISNVSGRVAWGGVVTVP